MNKKSVKKSDLYNLSELLSRVEVCLHEAIISTVRRIADAPKATDAKALAEAASLLAQALADVRDAP